MFIVTLALSQSGRTDYAHHISCVANDKVPGLGYCNLQELEVIYRDFLLFL